MDILIAGGAGFVGSNLAIFLAKTYPQYRITVLDNLSRAGSALNIPRLKAAGICVVEADTRFPEALAKLPPQQMIIDAAAEPSVLAGRSGSGLDYLIHTNLNGTIHLLDLARRDGSGFLFLSTSRVYPVAALNKLRLHADGSRLVPDREQPVGGMSEAGIAEAFPLEGARSLYGATKLASELMIAEYRDSFGLQAVINRCGVIAGPWQMGKVDQGVVALWLAKHLWQGSLQYIGYGGKGLQVRDMLHVSDLCRLVDYQLHHLHQLDGQTFNVGGGLASSASLAELTDACRQITGHQVAITASDTDRPGDIPWYVTDNSRITAATGWSPQMGVRDILQDTCQWMQEWETVLRPVLMG